MSTAATNRQADEALAIQMLTGVIVACRQATKLRVEFAIDHDFKIGWGTVALASGLLRTGYERVAVIPPGIPEEEFMGLAKKLYTSRSMGLPIPEGVMRIFGAHLVAGNKAKKVKGEGDDSVLLAHLQQPRHTAQAEIVNPEPVEPPCYYCGGQLGGHAEGCGHALKCDELLSRAFSKQGVSEFDAWMDANSVEPDQTPSTKPVQRSLFD
jgi:hypothetical protein